MDAAESRSRPCQGSCSRTMAALGPLESPQLLSRAPAPTSAANRHYLQAKGIGDLIQFKGSRGNPVHPLQTQMNRAIATLRYKVEQGGTMKRRLHLSRARYFGAAKTQGRWPGRSLV